VRHDKTILNRKEPLDVTVQLRRFSKISHPRSPELIHPLEN
jgi:hypothetical protein